MKKVRIGIDPGLDGFISADWDGDFEFHPMPTCKNKGAGKSPKNVVDGEKLSSIFEAIAQRIVDEEWEYEMVIEEVHSIYGSSSKATFGFGYGVGVLHGVVQSIGLDYELVQPKIWQKTVWTGEDIVLKPNTGKSIKDTKSTSIKAAKRLFPDVDLRKNTRCKVMHDGKADALLMTHYLKQQEP